MWEVVGEYSDKGQKVIYCNNLRFKVGGIQGSGKNNGLKVVLRFKEDIFFFRFIGIRVLGEKQYYRKELEGSGDFWEELCFYQSKKRKGIIREKSDNGKRILEG